MIKIPLSIAATVAAIGIALSGGIVASAQPAGTGPGAHNMHPVCGRLTHADGTESLAFTAKFRSIPLSDMIWAQDACTPARLKGFWLPKFARYITVSGGDFNVTMPSGTPLYLVVFRKGKG